MKRKNKEKNLSTKKQKFEEKNNLNNLSSSLLNDLILKNIILIYSTVNRDRIEGENFLKKLKEFNFVNKIFKIRKNI
jgi:hypothetical protein